MDGLSSVGFGNRTIVVALCYNSKEIIGGLLPVYSCVPHPSFLHVHLGQETSWSKFSCLMYHSNRSHSILYSFYAIYNIIWRSKLLSSRVKYITEDAASVCTWYLKFHTHVDKFRMPETPSVDLRHDLSCLVHATRHIT